MNLLSDGINQNSVIKTNITKKLTIDNDTQIYTVYKIKLDNLYYNDQNDRIATWIAKYKTDNNITNLDSLEREEYNDVIHKLITNSNRDAIKKTQSNIKLIGQQEVGVVLSEGLIIDGNRRFTCLRNIEKETEKTQYFEAIILNHNLKNNAKQIKILELMLQHGVDEKVSYDPIDKLVGIYNDIIDTKLLTIEEYANSVQLNTNEIKVEIEKAKLMVEFLEFINAPKQFHIAREFNLASSLQELYMMLKKINDIDKKEELKNTIFSQLLIHPTADISRYIRKIKKIISNDKFLDEFLDEQTELVEYLCDEIEKYPEVSATQISLIRANEDLGNKFLQSTEKFVNKTDGDTTRNKPAKQVEKAFDLIELIDINIFKKLTTIQKTEINNNLDILEASLKDIRRKLNDY